MNASEKAAAILNRTTEEAPGDERPATGERARLRELLLKDEPFTDDEEAEFDALSAKNRAGTIEGRPKRTVRKRESVAGDGDRDGKGRERTTPTTASEAAAARLRGF